MEAISEGNQNDSIATKQQKHKLANPYFIW